MEKNEVTKHKKSGVRERERVIIMKNQQKIIAQFYCWEKYRKGSGSCLRRFL
jgi:hypothetical protein